MSIIQSRNLNIDGELIIGPHRYAHINVINEHYKLIKL